MDFSEAYVKAQYPLEITEAGGMVAFEVALIVITAGAGAAGSVRHIGKLKKLKPLMDDLVKLLKRKRVKKGHSGDTNTRLESKIELERPKQVHHYATNKNKKYSPKLQKIADKYDLNLDEIWNKELLPHQGRHPNAYHEFVIRGMKQAHKEANGDKGKFLKLFEKYIKEPVRKNPDILRKKGWE